MILARHISTNSVNEDRRIQWQVFETEAEVKAWEKEFEAELDKWNFNTLSASSIRRGDMRFWTQEELEQLDLSDVEGLPLYILADVLKRLAP